MKSSILTIFFAAALIIAELSSVVSAGECEGILGYVNDHGSGSNQFYQFFCNQEYSSYKQARDAGLKVNIPIEEFLPISFEGHDRSSDFYEYKKSICYNISISSSYEYTKANDAVVDAWEKCVTSTGFHFWAEKIKVDDKPPKAPFVLMAQYRPSGSQNSTRTKSKISMQPVNVVTCTEDPPIGTQINAGGIAVNCNKNVNAPVTFALSTEDGSGSIRINEFTEKTKEPPPFNPTFKFSSHGGIQAMHCIQIAENADPDTWLDNFFCSDKDYGMKWSSAGPIENMRCISINESAEPYEHTWWDNFLCVPQDSRINFSFWTAGSPDMNTCTRWYESADPHTWNDNYVCWGKTGGNTGSGSSSQALTVEKQRGEKVLLINKWGNLCLDIPMYGRPVKNRDPLQVYKCGSGNIPPTNQLFHISSYGDSVINAMGMCLDIPDYGRPPKNGDKLQVYQCGNSKDNQVFSFFADGTIRPTKWKNLCLDLPDYGRTPKNGDRMQIYECNGGKNQTWGKKRFLP